MTKEKFFNIRAYLILSLYAVTFMAFILFAGGVPIDIQLLGYFISSAAFVLFGSLLTTILLGIKDEA